MSRGSTDNLARDTQVRSAHRLLSTCATSVIVAAVGVLGMTVAYAAAELTAGPSGAALGRVSAGGIEFFPGWKAWQLVLLLISVGMFALGGGVGALTGRRMKQLVAEARSAYVKSPDSRG